MRQPSNNKQTGKANALCAKLDPAENKPYLEAHAHIALDGVDFKSAIQRHLAKPDEEHVRSVLLVYSRAGISFVRDGGDHLGVSLLAKQISGEYGITYACPAFPIYKKGYYGNILGRPFSDLAEYASLVKEASKKNADFIKIFASGLLDFNRHGVVENECPLDYSEAVQLVKIAHCEGLSIMVHANGSKRVAMLAEAGCDSIEHGYYMDTATLDVLCSSKCCWVPTLAPVANLIGNPGFNSPSLEAILKGQLSNIKYALENGGLLAAGSDAGAYMVGHENGIFEEWELLISATEERDVALRRLSEGAKFIEAHFGKPNPPQK